MERREFAEHSCEMRRRPASLESGEILEVAVFCLDHESRHGITGEIRQLVVQRLQRTDVSAIARQTSRTGTP